MFSRVNSLGWALYEELTSAQMNQLDLNVSRAIDGVFGGTYNLSNTLTLNGTVAISNMVFTGGTVTNLTVSGTLTANTVNVSGIATFDNIASFHNTAIFGNNVFVQGSGIGFYFESTGTFTVSNGNLTVKDAAVARFESTVMFIDTADVTVIAGCDWTFYNWPIFQNGLRAYGNVVFNSAPSFLDGLTLAAGELVSYSTPQSWTIRFPFLLGTHSIGNPTHFEVDPAGFVIQISNGPLPTRLFCTPQGLWGGTAVTIAGVDFRVKANGLSGSPSSNTFFSISLYDQDWTQLSSASAIDSTPNSSTAHSVSWSGAIAFDPSQAMFMLIFNGYAGGDTLDGTSKWYQIMSVRMTLQTSAKGFY